MGLDFFLRLYLRNWQRELHSGGLRVSTGYAAEEGYGDAKETIEVEVRYRYNNGEMKRYEGGKI